MHAGIVMEILDFQILLIPIQKELQICMSGKTRDITLYVCKIFITNVHVLRGTYLLLCIVHYYLYISNTDIPYMYTGYNGLRKHQITKSC